MQDCAAISATAEFLLCVRRRFPAEGIYSTEFFRVFIRGYVRLYVSLSVSLSLNLYNREWTYFNETHHSLLPGPHDIFKVSGQTSSQAATAMEIL